MAYHVSITEHKAALAAPVCVLYAGLSYQKAFDAAIKARSVREFRGKWIKFEDGELGVTKWGKVL